MEEEKADKTILVLVWVTVLIIFVAAIFLYIQKADLEKDQAIQQAKLKFQKEKIRDAREKETVNTVTLNTLLELAREGYDAEWASEVKRLGSTDGTLPKNVAEVIEKHYQADKDDAYRRAGK